MRSHIRIVPLYSDIEGLEAISQKQFGEILQRLQKLVVAINSSPKRIYHYKNLCDELEMSNKNILVEGVRTRWNSTYDMIDAAWEKSIEGNGERPSKHKQSKIFN